jgi:hypothetical protein
MNNVSGEELLILANTIALLLVQDRSDAEIYVISGLLLEIASAMNLIANKREFDKKRSTPEEGSL